MTQPNALAAIQAALTGGKPPAPVPQAFAPQAAPAQTAFAFTPPTSQSFAAAPNPFQPSPFQPSPVQAAAAFVAAVPRAAEQHAHPTTGVPFAPINPPGEATSAPTVGLGAAPVPAVQVAVSPEAVDAVLAANPPPKAPKAPRARKPRAAVQILSQGPIEAGTSDLTPSHAGDGAGGTAAASAAPSNEPAALDAHSTETLVHELSERGWTITLRK